MIIARNGAGIKVSARIKVRVSCEDVNVRVSCEDVNVRVTDAAYVLRIELG